MSTGLQKAIERFKPKKKVERRIALIDFYKGLIILIMILTHVIALTFNHGYKDDAVYTIGLVGGISSFTAFLLLVGINGYLSVVKKDEPTKKSWLKIFGREIKIFATYYLLTVVALFFLNRGSFETPSQILTSIKDILTFEVLPEFTEFLPTIAIFTLSLILFKRFYKYLSENLLVSVGVGLIAYFIGAIFVNFDFGSNYLNSIKALFFGHLNVNERIHSFPVFQYFIVFLLGINIGRFLYENTSQKIRLNFIIKILLVTIPTTVILTLAYYFANLSIFYPLPVEGRFPPSLSFITLSLSISLIFLAVIDYLISYIPEILNKVLTFISLNNLGFLLSHLLVLFGFKYYFDNTAESIKPRNIQEIIIMFLWVMLLSYLIVRILNFLDSNILQNDKYKDFSRFIIVKAIPNIILIISISVFGIIVYKNFLIGSDLSRDLTYPLTKKLITEDYKNDWWDDSFKVKRQIVVNNKGIQDFSSNQWVEVIFNNEEAINSKLAFNRNGADIRVIYWNEIQSAFTIIPMYIDNPNKDSTSIKFQLKEPVVAGKEDRNYFLYYGSAGTIDYPMSTETVRDLIRVELSPDIIRHQIEVSVNKYWFLKTPNTKNISDALVIEANTNDSVINEKSVATYIIEGTSLKGSMDRVDQKKFSKNLDLSSLEPGIYTAQIRIVDFENNLKIYKSYKIAFRVTYPIYVTWSMDWEGWDVADYNLREMDNIANTYRMPITQLFNPRIYVENQNSYEKIFPERESVLTKWVLDRKASRGDEIGIHMHMFSDMVIEAGVQPRPGSIIGAAYGDAKTSDFTQSELEKIFKWGVDKFIENGLPRPITYRTGGWFSGPHVLTAAQNAGFLIDTSGRTGGIINPAIPYSSAIPWNLSTTTWPYKPTNGDINRWEGDRLSIWEFPNNGADSYWFTADELKNRFIENYTDPRGILDHPQVLTYLTHPHWLYSVDSPKLHILFKFLEQFKYENDSGPVIYTTLETAYKQWDKENHTNGN